MRSEFKSATQIYVNPIYFEIQLILRNDLFLQGPDDQNRWNRKNCPKFFHRVIFAFWIQICNPNLCKSHIFWITANIEKWSFLHWPDDQNRWNRKNCPKFFHRVIFAFWIQICNPNLCKSHIFWSTANIQKWPDEKLWNRKNCPKFFHRVFFAFWIQICNQNLCKYHTFWNTANIEKWSFFAFQDLMTKIDEIGKIARNSFIG